VHQKREKVDQGL